jgi:hypothetical protein
MQVEPDEQLKMDEESIMLTPRSLARSLGLAAVVAGLAALPFAAHAATLGSPNLSGEISAAQVYLSSAAEAKSVAAADRVLYGGLNCLEGPKGKWSYPKKFNPCYGPGYGNGAINDATSQKQMKMLERLATQAHAALMSTSLTTTHHEAMMIAAELKKME